MRKCVVIGAKRSPVGRFGGSLKDIPAADLAVQVITNLLQNSPVNSEKRAPNAEGSDVLDSIKSTALDAAGLIGSTIGLG